MRRLRAGSIVDIVAPSSAFDREAFLRGLDVLRAQGWQPRHRPDIFSRDRFLAGGDTRRLSELREALAAPDSDLLWCARGGYGATRILDALPTDEVRRAAKMIVGFSDITALHAVWAHAGIPSIHGTMAARLAVDPPEATERLFALLRTGRAPSLLGTPLVPGTARGRLAGGNLALQAAMCGTVHAPDFHGAIVFLEDTGERPYRLDRMLVQCRQAGLFRGIAGLALGWFDGCDDDQATAADVLREHAEVLGVPAVAGLPCGHRDPNHALPLGMAAQLDGETGRLEFPEPLWRDPAS